MISAAIKVPGPRAKRNRADLGDTSSIDDRLSTDKLALPVRRGTPQANQCQVPPTRQRIFSVRATQIRGALKRHRCRADKLFDTLPDVGNYNRDDKRFFLRRIFSAAYKAVHRSRAIWIELHVSKTTKAHRRVLDSLVTSGRLIAYKHRKDRCTRFWITDKFYAELVAYRPRRRSRESVTMRSRRDKIPAHRYVTISKGRHKGSRRRVRYTKRTASKPMPFELQHPVAVEVRTMLDLINAVNARHDFWCKAWNPYVKAFDGTKKQFTSHLTANFTDNFDAHGRNYTSGDDGYQAARASERSRFYIGDQRCVEFDFKCLHPRMAYNLHRLSCPGDCYSFLGPGRAARALAKKTFNTMLNAENEQAAAGSFRKATFYWKHERGTRAYRNSRILRAVWRAMGKPKPSEMFAKARQYHAAIQDFLFSDAGMKFMRLDGEIARRVMYRLALQGIPTANYHDSFLVPEQFAGELKRQMGQVYFEMFGFESVIEEKGQK